MIPDATIWLVIVLLGIGTYALRFSFLGAIGGRRLPDWMLRHLRYVAVAVLPGLVAPLVVFPEATAGAADPLRISAALAALAAGAWTRNAFAAVGAGAAALYLLPFVVSS